jgi:hypothetical protein
LFFLSNKVKPLRKEGVYGTMNKLRHSPKRPNLMWTMQ